jgi:Mrp family chromosome partitioning ATPase
MFHLEPGPGWAEVLLHGKEPLSRIRSSFVANLSVLAAGELNGEAARAFDAGKLSELIDALKEQFELVVFDMPAAGRLGFLLRLAGLVDGVLLVVEAERVRWEVARRAIEQLTRDDVRLLGAVLNKRRQHVPDWLYRTL